MKTNDDIVKEFREKFGIERAENNPRLLPGHLDSIESFLRTILATKDAEIERARQEGRDEIVSWIKKNARQLCKNGEPPSKLIDMWIVGNGDLSEAARAKNLPAKE